MTYVSQHGEDRFLESLFPNDYVGVCVEVGAYNGISLSNTYHFEKKGWKALCIEAIPAQYEECKRIRKESVHAAVSDKDGDAIEFTIFSLGDNQSAISGIEPDQRLIQSHSHLITDTNTISMKTRSLTSILDEYSYPSDIDFISIDVENTELKVLHGLDLNKYNVRCLVIENNFDEPECEEYLKQYGYRKIYRLAVNDFFIKN